MPTALRDLSVVVNWRIPHGDARTILFRLRRANNNAVLPVDEADPIQLRWWNASNVAQVPVVVNPGHPLADWDNGVVPVDLTSANVLAAIGTYRYSLTGFFGGPTLPRTWVIGEIEVHEAPGYPPA
jgi:hypothetical protein